MICQTMINLPINYQKVSGIYCIRNTENNKEYIGSTKNLCKRITAHRNALHAGTHHSPHLQRAFHLYGEHVFTVDVLELVEVERLIEREQCYLDQRLPEYNVAKFSNSGMRGRKHSDETRKIIKEKLGKKFTKEDNIKRATHAAQFSTTKEAREKQVASSKITRATKEYKEKMSKKQKELWADPNHRSKQVEAHKNYSKEVRERLSNAQKLVWSKDKKRLSECRRGRGRAILTKEQVIEIRRLYASGFGSFAKIANLYDVGRNTIYGVISRQNWGWIDEE